ncbi:MAG: hypothetical protein U0176_24445 [Bacteroidia bacterium]
MSVELQWRSPGLALELATEALRIAEAGTTLRARPRPTKRMGQMRRKWATPSRL